MLVLGFAELDCHQLRPQLIKDLELAKLVLDAVMGDRANRHADGRRAARAHLIHLLDLLPADVTRLHVCSIGRGHPRQGREHKGGAKRAGTAEGKTRQRRRVAEGRRRAWATSERPSRRACLAAAPCPPRKASKARARLAAPPRCPALPPVRSSHPALPLGDSGHARAPMPLSLASCMSILLVIDGKMELECGVQ